jgi:HEAT repeat protein
MSALAVALVVVGALLIVNILTAVGVRATGAWRNRREAQLEPALHAAVAELSIEARDELPRPRSSEERRLLERAILDAATEVSGAAHERLAAEFAALGFARDAIRDLRSRRTMRRVHAAEALGEMRVREGADALLAGLEDREPLVRFACAGALTRIGAEGALRPIIAALTSDRHGTTTGEVVETLLDYGRPAIVELVGLLESEPDPELRRVMAIALGELRALDAVPELIRCLHGDDDELAARAAHALGKIGDPRSAGDLAALVTGARAWIVRTAACGACGEMAAPEAPPALAQALGDENWHVRNAAATALVRLEDPGLAAVCARLDGLGDVAVLHLWSALEVTGRSAPAIGRAAVGHRDSDRLVRAALAAGARARLEEVADIAGPAGDYARELLDATSPVREPAGGGR